MSELSEQELAEIDLAVGQMERLDVKYNTYNGRIRVIRTIIYDPPDPLIGKFDECVYQPTRDPAEAMRLIERHKLTVTWWDAGGDGEWEARYWTYSMHKNPPIVAGGPTHMIAVARCVIALGATK